MSEQQLAPYRIEAARDAADIAAAQQLFLAYAKSLDFDLCFQNFEDELAALPGAYAPPGGALLLARDGAGTAVGVVALRPLHEPGCCEMKRLYLSPAMRGRGAGRQLVQAVIDEARRLGYRHMRLDTVASSMQAAIALYRQFGFQPIPPYTFNPQPDVVYLELAL